MKLNKLRKTTKELETNKPGQAKFQEKNTRKVKLEMKKKDKERDLDEMYITEDDILEAANKFPNFRKMFDDWALARQGKYTKGTKQTPFPNFVKAFNKWAEKKQKSGLVKEDVSLEKLLEQFLEENTVVDSQMGDYQPNLVDAVKAAIAGEPAAFQSAINDALNVKAVDAISQYRELTAQNMFNDQPPSEDYYADDESGPDPEDDNDDVEFEDDNEYETVEDEDDNTSEEE